MDIIQKLAQCDLGHEVYHADDFGHVQVETVSICGFETPSMLLEQIDQDSLWGQFFTMAKTQPEEWLIHLMSYFPEDKPYSTQCFVEFLTIISDRNALIFLVQYSSDWYWEVQNLYLMERVFEVVEQLIEERSSAAVGDDIDLIMLKQILGRLKDKKSVIEDLPL